MIRQSYGFSLIEVLISMVILSIGLLSVAGLQLRALKENHNNYIRTQSTIYANTITDSMRANLIGARRGAYNIDTNTISATTSVNCEQVSCNIQQLATWDATKWRNQLRRHNQIDGNNSDVFTTTGTVQCSDAMSATICSAAAECLVGPNCAVDITWTRIPVNPASSKDVEPEEQTINFELQL